MMSQIPIIFHMSISSNLETNLTLPSLLLNYRMNI